ncbi:hypothetical protein [Chryseobacterium culicis]|uniref:DUF3945 domain-containing protein n=1 Tax=Chryseobacterium culicis TaxID=680127 RepID=A0A1H6H2E9_CHRCI|nr:hypothetical protein [Chryseobacterium culicis]SEH29881.1 hypothetical protein SAMN05421593_1207 [Chryseobacterium culicis]
MKNERSRLDQNSNQDNQSDLDAINAIEENELKNILQKAQKHPENLIFPNEEIQNLFYHKIDLFDNEHLLNDELRKLINYYNNIDYGESSYGQCEEFQRAVEQIGYTFDYGLDALPMNLRPIDQYEQIMLYQNIFPENILQSGENASDKGKDYINLQTPEIMATQKEFDQTEYLKTQLKYLGFGEDKFLHEELEKGIDSQNQKFDIKATSQKALPGNKIDYTLNYNKTEKGGIFLNSYEASLTNSEGESLVQNFRVSKEASFTAKEALNLLEGRAVKIEFVNPKSNEREPAFVKLNFEEAKNQHGNYNFQTFYKNYGINAAEIVEKSNLVFDKPEYKAGTIKSLEKGNVVKVKFELDDQVIEGKAVLNPQYKNLNLYDSDMNRINTNKPLQGMYNENKHEKGNVREQNLSRGI